MTSTSKRRSKRRSTLPGLQDASTDELLTELRRRGFGVSDQRFLRYGYLQLDQASRHATYRGEEKKLSPRKFELLVTLAQIMLTTGRFAYGSELTALLYQGWTHREAMPSIRVYISQMRKMLPGLIETRYRGHRIAYGLNAAESV